MRLLLLTLLLSAPAHSGVVDRIVVVVEDELVLQSDIQLEQTLAARDAAVSPFWASDNGSATTRLTDAALVRAMAGGVLLYQPRDEQIDARFNLFKSTFESDEAWHGFKALWGLDDDAIRRMLTRRMVVEAYLLRNLPEDPAKSEVWLAACRALLDQVRGRYRVRIVPLRGE